MPGRPLERHAMTKRLSGAVLSKTQLGATATAAEGLGGDVDYERAPLSGPVVMRLLVG